MIGRESQESRREPIDQIEKTVEDLKKKIQNICECRYETGPEIPPFAGRQTQMNEKKDCRCVERRRILLFIRENVRNAVFPSENESGNRRVDSLVCGIRSKVLKEADRFLKEEKLEQLRTAAGKTADTAVRYADRAATAVLQSRSLQNFRYAASDLKEKGIRITKKFLDRIN